LQCALTTLTILTIFSLVSLVSLPIAGSDRRWPSGENFSAEKLKWRGFLRSRIETIEMADDFGFPGLKFLKWRGLSSVFALKERDANGFKISKSKVVRGQTRAARQSCTQHD
jgi:hypothetical protein